MTNLDMALRYAARGWHVLPIHSTVGGRCTCNKKDCTSPGKHPITKNGLHDATTDASIIRGWWSTHRAANIGIRTGAVSNLAVIDVDPRHGGDDTLLNLEMDKGKLPWTAEALTGGGGRHILFSHPGVRVKSKANTLGAGLDIRGDDAYIVAPPSMHISGGVYQWEPSCLPSKTPLAEMPAWLIEMVEDTAPVEHKRAETVPDEIPAGQRSDTMTSLAGTMRRRGMSPDSIYAALMEENRARCNPPMSADEISSIAHSVGRYQPTAPFMPLSEQAEKAQPRDPKDAYAVAVEFLDLINNISGRSIKTGLENVDTKLGGIERQTLSILAARPSMGKSTLAWQMARNVAATGLKVVFFSLEMSAPALWAKVACGAVGLRWLHFRTEQNTEDQLTQVIDKSVELMHLYGESLLIDDGPNTSETIWATVEKIKPDLVIVDHLRLVADRRTGEAREDQRLGVITQRMKDMAKGFNCAALLLAQLNRSVEGREEKRPTLSDLRDSGQIEENADVVWMLYRDDYYNQDDNTGGKRYSETELRVRKFRDDIKDTRVRLAFDTRLQWFEDAETVNLSELSRQRMETK